MTFFGTFIEESGNGDWTWTSTFIIVSSPEEDMVYWRFHGPLIVFMCVCWSIVVHNEGRCVKINFFSRRTGLMAWLHESICRRNPSSRSASFHKVQEKFAFLSPHVGRPGKPFLDHANISKLYPLATISNKCSNRQTPTIPPLPVNILHYCAQVLHAGSHSTAVEVLGNE